MTLGQKAEPGVKLDVKKIIFQFDLLVVLELV